jgi:hypothetical protein
VLAERSTITMTLNVFGQFTHKPPADNVSITAPRNIKALADLGSGIRFERAKSSATIPSSIAAEMPSQIGELIDTSALT